MLLVVLVEVVVDLEAVVVVGVVLLLGEVLLGERGMAQMDLESLSQITGLELQLVVMLVSVGMHITPE